MKFSYLLLFFMPFGFLWGGGEDMPFNEPNETNFEFSTTVAPTCTATVTPIDVDCFGENNGKIQVQMNNIALPDPINLNNCSCKGGGAECYIYRWKKCLPSAPNSCTINSIKQKINHTIDNLEPGTYSVTITDDVNSNKMNPVIVENLVIDEPPTQFEITNITSTPESYQNANNGSIEITANEDIESYTIDPNPSSVNSSPQTNEVTIPNLEDGTYEITITNAAGCTVGTSVTVYSPKITGYTVNPVCRESKLGLNAEHLLPTTTYYVKFNTASGFVISEGDNDNDINLIQLTIPGDAITGPISVYFDSVPNPNQSITTPSYPLVIKNEDEVFISGPSDTSFCYNNPPIFYSGFPPGGVFTLFNDQGVEISTSAPLTDTFSLSLLPHYTKTSITIKYTHSEMDCKEYSTELDVTILQAPFKDMSYNAPPLPVGSDPIELCNSNIAFEPNSFLCTTGFFWGEYVSDGYFSPDEEGQHTVYFSASNQNCTSTDSVIITVGPVSSIDGLRTYYCRNEPLVTIRPDTGIVTPQGGWNCANFQVSDIEGYISTCNMDNSGPFYEFNPMFLGDSPTRVTATYLDTIPFVQDIILHPIPTITINVDSAYCPEPNVETLTATPTTDNSKMYIDTTETNMFTPFTLGAGQHSVTFYYDDISSTGCVVEKTDSFTIHPDNTGIIDYQDRTIFCNNEGMVKIEGIPAGGFFTGTIVNESGDSINTNMVSGNYTISYTFTNSDSCEFTREVTDTIFIVDATEISFEFQNMDGTSTSSPFCINEDTIALIGDVTGTNPTGISSFYIQNSTQTKMPLLTNNDTAYLDPSNYNIGNYDIIFEYTDNSTDANCVSSSSIPISIVGLPTPTIDSTIQKQYCQNGSSFSLSVFGKPEGGRFFLQSQSPSFSPDGLTFFPDNSQSGPDSFIYEYTDDNGCTNQSPPFPIDVYALPEVIIDSMNETNIYCLNNGIINLYATPANGVFRISGGGYSSTPITSIDPIIYEVGTEYTLDYTYNEPHGPSFFCSNSDSKTIQFIDIDPPTLDDIDSLYCLNDGSIIPDVSPEGGDFFISYENSPSSPISSTGLDTEILGVGRFTLTYTYSESQDTVSCSKSVSTEFEIIPLPNITIDNLDNEYCVNSAEIQLQGSPSGGDFRVTDTINNTSTLKSNFTPSELGAGQYIVSYTYTEPNSGLECQNKISQNVNVLDTVAVVIQNIESQYCLNHGDITLEGSEQGGYFTLSDQDTTIFIPSTINTESLGAGDFTIRYYYQDGICTSSAKQEIEILDLPNADFTITPAYCRNEGIIVLPTSDGTYTIGNTTITEFDTQTLGDGQHTITHTVSQDNMGLTCYNSFSLSIEILPPPVPIIENVDPEYCLNHPSFSLLGNNFNQGNFSITNDTLDENISSFEAATYGTGFFAIHYEDEIVYSDYDNLTCTEATFIPIEIMPLAEVEIIDLAPFICQFDPPINLQGNHTPSGYFQYKAPNGNQSADSVLFFTPNQIGPYDFVYSHTDTLQSGLECTNTATQTAIVRPLPTAQIDNLDSEYCLNDLAINLVGQSDSTGIDSTFTIIRPNGDSLHNQTEFNPNIVGPHQVIFTVKSQNLECENQDIKDIFVHDLPSGLELVSEPSYCTNQNIVIFNKAANDTGNGKINLRSMDGDSLLREDITGFVQDTLPNPDSFPAPGEYLLELVWTNDNGCNSTITKPLTIYAPPIADFYLEGFCVDETLIYIDNSITPNGGEIIGHSWLINDLEVSTNDTLFIDDHDYGPITISHSVTTINGCSDVITKTDSIGTTPKFNYQLAVASEGFPLLFSLDPLETDFGLTRPYDSIAVVTYNFGDGTIIETTDLYQVHTYQTPGSYETSIQILTDKGCSRTIERLAYVVPHITEIPHCSDFTDEPWYSRSRNHPDTLWRLEPATSIEGRSNIWATHANKNTLGYQAEADGWVYGPSFDLTDTDRPFLSIDLYFDNVYRNDGLLLEVSNDGNNWIRLGKPNLGLNWYQDVELITRPGDIKNLSSGESVYGWSGNSEGWQTARFKLDAFKGSTDLRVRVAFATISAQTSNTARAAFDNFCIKERQNNVLMEHFTNLNPSNAVAVDQEVYAKCFEHNYDSTFYNSVDINFAQYHISQPSPDDIYLANQGEMNARAQRYGIGQPFLMEINGQEVRGGLSTGWSNTDIDRMLLTDPNFDIEISNQVISNNQVSIQISLQAKRNLSFDEGIDLNILVLEDSISQGRMLRNVVRKMLPNPAGINLDKKIWITGETVTFTETWDDLSSVNNPNNLFTTVFVQNSVTDEVYQSVSNRVVVIPEPPTPTAINNLNNEQALTLHPNPTSQQVTVSLSNQHNHIFQWELFDAMGKKVATGEEGRGTQSFSIKTKEFTTGMYFLVLHAKETPLVIQEKLIIIH